MDKVVRVALIGCGVHSRKQHAASLARFAREHPGEVELAACCDLKLERAQAFSREFSFARAYGSIEKMLDAEELDGCISVMPVDQIVEVSIGLLERNMPCTVEKPLGRSREEAHRLADVARQTGTAHMVSVNRRFIPYLNRALSWAKDGGPIRYVRAAMVRHARRERSFIWSTAIHAVDALRYLAGQVEEFEAYVQDAEELSALWFGVSFRFADGIRGRLDILPTAGMKEESYDLFGEGFRARLSSHFYDNMHIKCWRDGKLALEDYVPDDEAHEVLSGGYAETVEFLSALGEGRCPNPSIEDILPSQEICFDIARELQRTCAGVGS
jgi:predicted dehydrogenase